MALSEKEIKELEGFMEWSDNNHKRIPTKMNISFQMESKRFASENKPSFVGMRFDSIDHAMLMKEIKRVIYDFAENKLAEDRIEKIM
jgi:hypothetical protein